MGFLVRTDAGYVTATDLLWREREPGLFSIAEVHHPTFGSFTIGDLLEGPHLGDLLSRVIIIEDETMERLDSFKAKQKEELEAYAKAQDDSLQSFLKEDVARHGFTSGFKDIRQEV